MKERPQILHSIFDHSYTAKKECLDTADYRTLTDIIRYQLLFMRKGAAVREIVRTVDDDALGVLVNYHLHTKSNGFGSGSTMNVVSLLTKLYEITGKRSFLKNASILANSFLEYFRPDLSINSGMCGNLLGFIQFHSVAKVRSVIEDINIYADFVVSTLDTYNGADASYTLARLSKYINNSSFLDLAIRHYNKSTVNTDRGLLWSNSGFSYCMASLLLWRYSGNKKYLRNFTAAFQSTARQPLMNAEKINLMYLLRLRATLTGAKADWGLYQRVISDESVVPVWQEYPWHFGSLVIALQEPAAFSRLDAINPKINGHLTNAERKIPMFSNALFSLPKVRNKTKVSQPIVE